MRTKAERSVDKLTEELQRLRLVDKPSPRQRARIFEIEHEKLPAAWRAVRRVRDRE